MRTPALVRRRRARHTARAPRVPLSTAGALAVVTDRHALGGRGRGLLVTAAADVTPELVNRMIHLGRGISALLVDVQTAFALGLRDMPATRQTRPRRPDEARYLASIEAATGVTTGISAEDRARTLRAAGEAGALPEHFVSPGHVMPLLVPARSAGAPSLHQAALKLVQDTSGSRLAAACDILDDHGDTADHATCVQLARRHGLALLEL